MDYLLWIIVMFLSSVWTLILTAPIHCRASTGEQVIECYISPDHIYILDELRVGKFFANCHFCMNYSFNALIIYNIFILKLNYVHFWKNDIFNMYTDIYSRYEENMVLFLEDYTT